MTKETFNILMNVIHPSRRYEEWAVRYYFETVFNTEFDSQMWNTWKRENEE